MVCWVLEKFVIDLGGFWVCRGFFDDFVVILDCVGFGCIDWVVVMGLFRLVEVWFVFVLVFDVIFEVLFCDFEGCWKLLLGVFDVLFIVRGVGEEVVFFLCLKMLKILFFFF